MLCSCILCSCMGYQMGDLIPERTIGIPIFKNKTLYRGYEFTLTTAVEKEILTQTQLQILSPNNADTILKGTITEIQATTVEKDKNKRAIRLDVHVTVLIEWYDKTTQRNILPSTKISDTVEAIVSQGESTEDAISEGLSKIARRIVYAMEHPFWQTPWEKEKDPEEKALEEKKKALEEKEPYNY